MADETIIRDLAIMSAIVFATFLTARLLVTVEDATGVFTFFAVVGGVGTLVFTTWAISNMRS